MDGKMKFRLKEYGKWIGALALPLAVAQPASAIDLGYGWNLHGWARQYLSWNTNDQPLSTAPYAPGVVTDSSAWDLSMSRQSLFLDMQGPTGPLHWVVRTRFSYEEITQYESKLARMTGNTTNLTREYIEYDAREAFFDWTPNDRLSFRVGRQQVVWGETDFFHATDVIQGYDLSWRKFLNPSSEEVRKPLFMINGTINVPEVDGSLQLLVRPGIDDKDWIGNTEPTFGGRWSNTGAKGFDLMNTVGNNGIASVNYRYSGNGIDADYRDPSYGIRWLGNSIAGHAITYALNYYHGQGGFFQDGILIFDPVHPHNGNPLQFIYPETDTVGGSISGFIPVVNAVYRAEVAYTPDRVMSNVGGAFVKNDAYNYVLGLDLSPQLQHWIGTSNSSLVSFQAFDWYLPGIHERNQVVRFDGSGYFRTHNIISTVVFSNPYFNDNLNVTLVGLADFTYGGGMVIPSVEYQYRANWRFKVEYDKAMGGQKAPPSAGGLPGAARSVFGSLQNDDQLLVRITYQF